MTEKEYNASVDAHANSLFRFIFKNLRVREDAENIVQDTFETLWVNLQKVDAQKCKNWLFTTAYRKMIDSIRKNKKVVEMPEHFEPDATHQSQPDLKDLVHAALSRLPEIQKTVILLRDYEGYDYKEIGEITGLNESQVKVYIFRGRQTMKNFLVNIENIL